MPEGGHALRLLDGHAVQGVELLHARATGSVQSKWQERGVDGRMIERAAAVAFPEWKLGLPGSLAPGRQRSIPRLSAGPTVVRKHGPEMVDGRSRASPAVAAEAN